MEFSYISIDHTSGSIYYNDDLIASIRDLRLCNVRFKPNGALLIGENVALPLYWEQYANHRHPERNTGSHGLIECMEAGDRLVLKIIGESFSREVRSEYIVRLRSEKEKFVYHFDAALRVNEGKQWLVTPNRSHGELEFCHLWSPDTFVTERDRRKKFSACYVQRGDDVVRIPHHHLESSDKHNIEMNAGNNFFWLLEDENPVVGILSRDRVHAGLCAYMWDAHFAYKICETDENVFLKSGDAFSAAFELHSVNRSGGEKIIAAAHEIHPVEIETTPIYMNGLNTFTHTLASIGNHERHVWPWSTETDAEHAHDVVFQLDRSIGYDDQNSLRISSKDEVHAAFVASTLGPAFGDDPFVEGSSYRLSAYVKCEQLDGTARIALRFHRDGDGSVFEMENYGIITSERSIQSTCPWTFLDVRALAISPAPDRMHIMLMQDGKGTSWFDNVLFERIFS